MLPYAAVFGLRIPLYGLLMALGMLTSAYVAFLRVRRTGGDGNSLIIIAACAVGCALVGSKLLYILASGDIRKVAAEILRGDFRVFSDGGEVFYGGLLGGIGGAFLGARIARADAAAYCEAIVPAVPLGHAFGRLGCFFAGCCHGLRYDGPCAVRFPAAGIEHGVFPVQLLESALNLLLFALLVRFTRARRGGFYALYLYLALYAPMRFALEFLRGDAIRGAAVGLSTSQWISMALLAVGGLALLFYKKRRPRGPLIR